MKTLFLYIVNAKTTPVLAGLSAIEWLVKGAENTPYRLIEEGEPILPQTDYFALLTPATPLVTARHLTGLIEEMERRGFSGLEIGDGFLIKTAAYKSGFRPKRRVTEPFADRVENAEKIHKAEKVLYRRIAEISAQNGAIIPDVDAVRIDGKSVVERGATVEPYAIVKASRVQCGAVVGSFSEVENAVIGQNARVTHSVVRDSTVGQNATVGPFAYIRNQSVVGDGCRIGDFVEIKNSTLGEGVKASHLAYVGDATVGEGTNVGCGTVFANYDGVKKRQTKVGKGVFIGANTNLVAPVVVGDNAYIAAATTVTEDVPSGAFVIGRVRAEKKQRKNKLD